MRRLFVGCVALAGLCLTLVAASTPHASLGESRPMDAISSGSKPSLESGAMGNHEAPLDIMDDIKRGQAFLQNKTAGYTEELEQKTKVVRDRKGRRREKVVSEKVIKPNFLLAVEDLSDRKIWPVRITSKGCVTSGFEVTKCRANGVGSRFEVEYPEHMAVLALRTMVHSEGKSYKEVVYTPYSPEIDTMEVRKAGLAYLMCQIELAYRDLKTRNVRLGGFSRLEARVTPTEVALVLSIIEHIDPLRFKNCPEGQETALVHEVLTVIGANTVNAYAYSKSPAGARGLFQFIPKTYNRIREKYPEAKLNRRFVAGCNDHVNAAKASLLLFDSDLGDVSRKWLLSLKRNVRAAGLYLAAAYNCGAKRVEESAKECGNQWACRLPEETRIYLKKFDVVWDMRKDLDR
ncbi:MAG TPA: transglycosylase SLT domain-containing protein [Syntrophorhabdales bacterium]|nr:transglycosylase SLT domain-containing protein [Syntrophorhabdales bacterium]